jgi:hypothetical protein
MPGYAETTFWSEIDAILVVNLAHRSDRWDRLHARLAEIGVADKLHRIDAIDGKTLPGFREAPWFSDKTPDRVARMRAGTAGCCLSHRKAISYAREQGFDTVLVMEDDANFLSDLTGRDGEIIGSVLADRAAWDMFYLGFYQKLCKHHVAVSESIDGEPFELWRIRGPLMFHATVLNRRIFDRLLNGLPETGEIWSWMSYWGSMDSWIQNRFGRDRSIRIWATMPKLVVQYANYSDICDRVLTTEESEGSHFEMKRVPLDADEFEKCLDRSPLEVLHQTFKRSGRRWRSRLFGYRKP